MTEANLSERVRALEAELERLRYSEELFRSLVSNIPGACYRTDAATHTTLHLDESIVEIIGYRPVEFMGPNGLTLYGLIHPDDRPLADAAYAAAMARRDSFEVELRFLHKDGIYRWVMERGRGIFDAEGRLAFYDGIFFDVTDRRLMFERLSASERQFKTLIENIPGSCYRASARQPYHLEYLSEAFTEVTGYPVAEFVGPNTASDERLILPEDVKMVRETIDEALAARRPFMIEYRIRHKNGSVRWMLERGQGIFDENGDLLHVHGVVFDVTDRVAANERARLLEAAVECTEDTIEITGADFRLRYVNPAFERTTGLTPGQVLGKTPGSLLRSGHLDDAHYDTIAATLGAGQVWQGELITPHPDGRTIFQDATISPIRDAAGQIQNFVAVKRDVSERRRMEDALRAALDRANEATDRAAAQERLATIGQIAATVSHELRNPLTAIRTSTALLRTQAASPESRRALERIERGVLRCTAIIQDLLAFTEPEALRTEATILDDWLESVLNGIDLPAEVDMTMELVSGDVLAIDRRQLALAVGNLVENAAAALTDPHWTPATGHRRRIEVHCGRGEGGPLLTIRDNGPGIPPDLMGRVFEPLFTTRSFGVGLGLPIARQVVEEHGGALTLESEPGAGTAVTMRLPRETKARAAA